MREHIFDTMDVASGQVVLGDFLPERRLHSVQSLSVEAGLNVRTLRNVLAARGLIPVEKQVSGHHVFDAEAGRQVAASVQRLTHVTALDKILGCIRPLTDLLLDERLMRPILDGPIISAGSTWKGVDDREVARFLEALHADARPVDVAPPGMVPVARAAAKVRLLSVEIVHLLLGDFIENVARLRDAVGYSAILVDPEDVRKHSHLLIGMSASAAFNALKIPKATGRALWEREEGPRLDAVKIVGANERHGFYRFTTETVAAFRPEFTTVAHIAQETEIWTKDVAARVRKCRVRPVVGRHEIGVDLYRRCEMPDFQPE